MTRRCALVLALAACGGAPPAVRPLALSGSPPLPLEAEPAAAVVDQGDVQVVLGGRLATVVRGGAVAARVEAPGGWVAAATIAAPDGAGRWIVAIDADGAAWRLTSTGEREAIADRFGLAGAKVIDVGGAGATTAFALADAVAYTTDGLHLARVPAAPASHLAVARGVLARAVTATAARGGYLEKWDLVRGTRVTYPIAAERLAFLDANGAHPRLVAAAGDRLWVDDGRDLRPLGAPGPVQGLAARGSRLWVAAGGKLFALDGARLVPTDVREPKLQLLAASPSGDAWLATDRGLVRYAAAGAATADPSWQAQVAPVFQRVCSKCHLPGGDADVDLSTAASWHAERSEIVQRVLVARTMPPAGTELSDADRAALAAWLGAPP